MSELAKASPEDTSAAKPESHAALQTASESASHHMLTEVEGLYGKTINAVDDHPLVSILAGGTAALLLSGPFFKMLSEETGPVSAGYVEALQLQLSDSKIGIASDPQSGLVFAGPRNDFTAAMENVLTSYRSMTGGNPVYDGQMSEEFSKAISMANQKGIEIFAAEGYDVSPTTALSDGLGSDLPDAPKAVRLAGSDSVIGGNSSVAPVYSGLPSPGGDAQTTPKLTTVFGPIMDSD